MDTTVFFRGRKPGRVRMCALCIAVAAMSLSCILPWSGLWERQRLSLSLPELPPSWAALEGLSFSLSWIDAEGTRCFASLAPAESREIEVRRGDFQAISALPLYKGRALRPAGLLYPDCMDPAAPSLAARRLRLSWLDGYLAQTALKFGEAGLNPERFNFARLRLEAASRLSDPWLLSPASIARAAAAGRFSLSLLKEPRRFPAALPFLPDGELWAPESPLAPTVDPLSATSLLPAGIHRFVSRSEELYVLVDASGLSDWIRIELGRGSLIVDTNIQADFELDRL